MFPDYDFKAIVSLDYAATGTTSSVWNDDRVVTVTRGNQKTFAMGTGAYSAGASGTYTYKAKLQVNDPAQWHQIDSKSESVTLVASP